jgi:quercetin dioxygenase-like cupin family protein
MNAHTTLPFLPLVVFVWSCATPPAPSTAATPAATPSAAAPALSTASTSAAPAPSAAASASAAQAPAPPAPPVELSAEPSHHFVLENKYLRAYKVEILPGGATLNHHHGHDFVTVAVGSAELSNEVEGKAPASVKMQDGLTRFTEGGVTHLVRNVGSAPFHNVTIEFLQDDPAHKATPPKWDEESGTVTSKGGTREILFVKDGVRVSSMVLQPGAAEPKRQHAGPEFVVAVTDAELGKGAGGVELKAGDVKWLEGGAARAMKNTGKEEAKVVLLEFK